MAAGSDLFPELDQGNDLFPELAKGRKDEDLFPELTKTAPPAAASVAAPPPTAPGLMENLAGRAASLVRSAIPVPTKLPATVPEALAAATNVTLAPGMAAAAPIPLAQEQEQKLGITKGAQNIRNAIYETLRKTRTPKGVITPEQEKQIRLSKEQAIEEKARTTGKVPYQEILSSTADYTGAKINDFLAKIISVAIPLTPSELATNEIISAPSSFMVQTAAKELPALARVIKQFIATKPVNHTFSSKDLGDFFVFGRDKLTPEAYDLLATVQGKDPDLLVKALKSGEGITVQQRVPRFKPTEGFRVRPVPEEGVALRSGGPENFQPPVISGGREGTLPGAPTGYTGPGRPGLPPNEAAAPGQSSGPTTSQTDPVQTANPEAGSPSTGTGPATLPVHPAFENQPSVFRPKVPYADIVTQHPNFVKLFSDEDATVRHYAAKLGRPVTDDFVRNIGEEIHHDFRKILLGEGPEAKAKAEAAFRQKYAWARPEQISKDMLLLRRMAQSLEAQNTGAGLPSEKLIQRILDDYTEDSRPQAGLQAERGNVPPTPPVETGAGRLSRTPATSPEIPPEGAARLRAQVAGEAGTSAIEAKPPAPQAVGPGQILNAESFRNAWKQAAPQLSDKELDAVTAVTEARAETWAALNNKPKEEWYRSRIAGVEPGGKPAGLMQEGTLQPERKAGPPRAEFIGYNPPFEDFPATPLYNIMGDHPSYGSTVSPGTLKKFNIEVPATPSYAEWEQARKAGRPLFQAAERSNAPTFYSQLQKTIQEKVPNRAPVEQVRNILKGGTVKQDEIDWSGIEDFLQGKQTVSKQELLDFLKQNEVQVREVVKSNESLAKAPFLTEAEQNEYERLDSLDSRGLLTPTQKIRFRELSSLVSRAIDDSERAAHSATKFENYVLPGGENYREMLLTLPGPNIDPNAPGSAVAMRESGAFQSSHFSEPNILAHVRFNDRVDAAGKKVLFIEEIQSDWGQALRAGKEVPRMPMSKSWPELAFKRMLRYAAENGYDKIAWTTGAQQAERYDLGKQIQSVEATPVDGGFHLEVKDKHGIILTSMRYEKSQIPDVVGKDLAEKIVADNGGTYSGLELRVGGEGMKGFYDQILPAFANKYTKKWGARVGTTEIRAGNKQVPTGRRAEQGYEIHDTVPKLETVHSLDITPSMKQSVLQEGQPLFQGPKGSVEFLNDGRAIIRAFKSADVSTAIHELGHIFRRDVAPDDLPAVEQWAGVKDGNWTREAEEKFARAFERYIRTGEAPSRDLQVYFDMLADWMRQIYKAVHGSAIAVNISPAVRDVFDRLFTPAPTRRVTEKEVLARAKRLYQQALAERRAGGSPLAQFVRENGGIAPYKPEPGTGKRPEWEEYSTSIPLNLRGGVPYDEMLQMAKDAGALPADAGYSALYRALKGTKGVQRPPKVGDFLDQARHELESEPRQPLDTSFNFGKNVEGKPESVLFQKDEGDLFLGPERFAPPAPNRTRQPPPAMLDALQSPESKFHDLTMGEAAEFSTLAPIRAAERMDGKRFGLMKDHFLQPIQDADKSFHVELRQKQEEMNAVFKGLSRKDRETIFDVVENKAVTANPRIQAAVEYLRKEYHTLITRINNVRADVGKDPIQERANYITHYQELTAIQDILQMFNMNMTEVPASMLTISNFTKPNSPYFKYAKRRLGQVTDRDAKAAYGRYLEPALRTIHFSKAVKNGRDILEYKVEIPSEYEGGKIDRMSLFGIRYPNAYKYWTKYLNRLSGKREPIDKMFPAAAATVGLLNRLFSAGSIGANISTILNQPSSLRNTVAETGPFALKGQLLINTPKWLNFYQTKSRIGLGRSYEPTQKGERLMGSKLLAKGHDLLSAALSIPVGLVDQEMVGGAFLSGYFKGKALGLSETDAIRYADDVAERTQASANLVDRPPANAGKLKVGLGQFQTFIFNEWSQIKNDFLKAGDRSYQEYGEGLSGLRQTRGEGYKKFAQFLLATAALSAIYDWLGLPNPTKQENATFPLFGNNALNEIWRHVINQVPYVSSVRFGGSPAVKGILSGIVYLTGDDRQRAEAWRKLKAIGVRLIPGGGQAMKTFGALPFAVKEKDLYKKLKLLAFGKYQGQQDKTQGGIAGRRTVRRTVRTVHTSSARRVRVISR